jgi:hypothetical protein
MEENQRKNFTVVTIVLLILTTILYVFALVNAFQSEVLIIPTIIVMFIPLALSILAVIIVNRTLRVIFNAITFLFFIAYSFWFGFIIQQDTTFFIQNIVNLFN